MTHRKLATKSSVTPSPLLAIHENYDENQLFILFSGEILHKTQYNYNSIVVKNVYS